MKRLALGLVAVFAFVGGSCGDGDDENPALEAPAAEHNEADVAFAHGMIPHHEQAIEMSEMALVQASSPKVKDLATRIKNAQGPEIDQMKGWLARWGEPVTPSHGQHGGQGMLDDAEMARLRAASGTGFDRLFLDGMIRHHEGAVTMAKEEQAKGMFAEAKELAGRIIAAQEAEIAQMRGLLGELR
jgi:uncharacterized protein (DUF305 family)